MSSYYGDFLVSKIVRCRFNTVNSSGVPTTLSSGAVIVSKDGSDVTPSTPPTLGGDVGGVTGRNHVIIDMSVDGTTYSAGSEYSVRLSGSSNVSGTSVVGIVVGEWSVENRSVAVDANGKVLLQPVTHTSATIPNVTTLTTYTGNTPQTGDAYARLGAPAGASHAADVAAVKSDTGTILTDVNTGAGAIYTRIGAPVGASISADVAALKTDLDAGVNVVKWTGNAVASTNVNGVPIVDIKYVLGSLAAVSNGTAQAGASSTITLASGEPATTDYYKGRQITIVAGTAIGQARFITAYNGSTKVATVHRAWDVNPDNTSQYSIDGLTEVNVSQFGGSNVVLDGNNLPNVNAKDWNGIVIASSVPNPPTSAAIAAATAASILATPSQLLATDSTGRVSINSTQSLGAPRDVSAVADGSMTVNDAMWGAVLGAAGRKDLVSTTVTLATPATHTTYRVSTVDSSSAPTFVH